MSGTDLQLPFPPDSQQLEFLRLARDEGAAIASEGTPRYDAMCLLVELGYMKKTFCPKAQKVFQFELTPQGKAAPGVSS
ncbi:MAG: hypothetical protein AAGI11_15370 [Pseudomonadota bacterium]